MLPKCSMVAITSLALACAPALANAPNGPQGTTTASRVPDQNEKVCADIVVTGSRIARQRICATKAEWEAMKKEDQDLVNQIQRSSNFGCDVIGTHSGPPTC